jgi:hypothetical protein
MKLISYVLLFPLYGIYQKEGKSLCVRDVCTPMLFAALFIIAKIWNHPLMDE